MTPDDNKPPEHPTAKIDQLEVLKGLLSALRQDVHEGVAELRADIQLVSSDLNVVKERVRIVELWKIEADTRMERSSNRVRENSQQDVGQDAAIAAIKVDVESTKAKVDAIEVETKAQTVLLADIRKLAANPIVKQIATMVGTAILTWLASKGLR